MVKAKVLIDENLSYRLKYYLADHFLVEHIDAIGLGGAGDEAIWEYARKFQFTICANDTDFVRLLGYYGNPPKVILLKNAQLVPKEVAKSMIDQIDTLLQFLSDPIAGLHIINI